MSHLIQDYLQTQGLDLNQDSVRIAQTAAEAVIQHGQAHIESPILWYTATDAVLSEHIHVSSENQHRLKQIFMALDSVVSRCPTERAAVYGLLPESKQLIRLAHHGKKLENCLPINDAYAQTHLAVRTAQTGWLNHADDVSIWLANDCLSGTHNHRSHTQASLPISNESGRIFGIIHLENHQIGSFDDEIMANWVGLALALQPILAQLLPSPLSQDTETV